MRKKIVAGNWKMNLAYNEAKELVNSLNQYQYPNQNITKILFPPQLYIQQLMNINSQFLIGSQNVSQYNNGAYTGEVSATMLTSINCNYVLIGHSERRHYFNETDEILIEKVKLALQNNLNIIYCIGEDLIQRQNETYLKHLSNQISYLYNNINKTDCYKISIAYEPIWAIGTGLTASPNQAEEVHAFLRNEITKLTSIEIAENTSIIYGGSCNAQNAKSLFECANIDGGLIGGASLKTEDFYKIINSL
ncbi:MAG: triose-phosphate isomerase [Bacteroidetes bacterium]|nr:triose-phosphate isomerase [Bacteroidota bacterium]